MWQRGNRDSDEFCWQASGSATCLPGPASDASKRTPSLSVSVQSRGLAPGRGLDRESRDGRGSHGQGTASTPCKEHATYDARQVPGRRHPEARVARSPQERGHLTSCGLCLLLARLSRGLPVLPSFCTYTPTSPCGRGGGPWTRSSLKAQARPAILVHGHRNTCAELALDP